MFSEKVTAYSLPQITRIYQHYQLDSTRWQHYRPRADDIIIATSYKSGTTWVQMIVYHLLGLTQPLPPFAGLSPWLERRLDLLDAVMSRLEAQTHRRFLKTHLALDGLPYFPQVKYLVVGRDARDVFMSFWNHYSNYTDVHYTRVNNNPGRVGAPLPRCPDDLHELWRTWMTRGWFPWESEGYPFWGNLHHTQSWWNYRHLDNLFFVHFNDLLTDLPGEIRRIAHFLQIDVTAEMVAAVVHAVQFDKVKQNAEQWQPGADNTWQGGAQTFFFKGVNGRWQGVLTPEELALHTAAVERVLTPACAAWLAQGRVRLLSPAEDQDVTVPL